MCTHIHNVQAEKHKRCWLFAPRSDMMISCHYGSPLCWRQLMMSTLASRPLLLVQCQSHAYTQALHGTRTTQIHIGWVQFSLATSVLCINVLIMIGFVCNYKHSDTPISKSLMKFRPMGTLGCFWKMHTHRYILTNTHTTMLNFKNGLLSDMSEQVLHTPWRPLPSSPRSALVACACRVELSPGLSCITGLSLFYFFYFLTHKCILSQSLKRNNTLILGLCPNSLPTPLM